MEEEEKKKEGGERGEIIMEDEAGEDGGEVDFLQSSDDDMNLSGDGEEGGEWDDEEGGARLSDRQRLERMLVRAGKGRDGEPLEYKAGTTEPIVDSLRAMRKGQALQVRV